MIKEVKLVGLSKEIFLSRYAHSNELEWSDRAKVVSRVVSNAEQDSKKDEWNEKFFSSISSLDLIPGGRILFGAGRNKFNLLNCYVLWPEDSVESISQIIKDTYQISCAGGGIGYDFSRIRPRGDDIQNIKNSAPGSVSVMQMINEIGEHVRSGGGRRTALMAILRCDHPDLFEFLDIKLNKSQLNNFNISVGITNSFIEAVEKNKEWKFSFRNKEYSVYSVSGDSLEKINTIGLDETDALERANQHIRIDYTKTYTKVEKIKVYARDIWDKIFSSSIECGDPGIFNVDFTNEYTNVSYFENMPATNPCGEEPLPPYGNCCLGHINLSNMVSMEGIIDWKRLAKAVRVGIRFLDNVLSINHYPVSECRAVGDRSRRIGLGTTGLHYFLIKAGYRYGDETCCEFVERLYQTIRDEAYKASIEIAKEKGSFPAFDREKFLNEGFANTLPPRIRNDIKKFGIRNAVCLTAAPCGTNSMVAGVSTGIEPIFSPIYERKYRDGNIKKTQLVTDPLFKYLFSNMDKRYRLCVGAYDVTPEEHIRIQASIQKYVDSAISKTCNLPKNTKYEDLKEIIFNYAPYVKGFTIYRAGSKGEEPLKDISIQDKSDKEIESIISSSVGYGTEEVAPSMCNLTKGTCE